MKLVIGVEISTRRVSRSGSLGKTSARTSRRTAAATKTAVRELIRELIRELDGEAGVGADVVLVVDAMPMPRQKMGG